MPSMEVPAIPKEPKIGIKLGLQKRTVEENVRAASPSNKNRFINIKRLNFSPGIKKTGYLRASRNPSLSENWTPFDSNSS